jgi:hypothetical protein
VREISMTVVVKPYRVLYTFFDNAGTKIYEKEVKVDGARDLPNIQNGNDVQLAEGTQKVLGTVYEVQYYIEVSNADMIYSMYVRCKNSHF